ncbi:MAG: IPT/TIG domain-containing protein, partial [Dehalococcoidia bacterium]|nr:IPT/TIG domain-containing protein [Dehalococcoidia bacterium]
MKYNKIFRVLAVVIIVSLLALVIPATPAAAASISLSPTSGRSGTTLTVTGTGFPAGTYIEIQFDYSTKQWLQLGTETSFTVSFFTVPNVSPGTYLVQAVDGAALTLIASANFTVISASIDIDRDDGQVGTEVEIDGEDFDANEDITVEYDGDDIDIEEGDDDTDSDGDFSCTIIIPESAAGEHTITVTSDDTGATAEAEFTVEPAISISPTEGAAGTSVTISGTGFNQDEDITISFAASEISTAIETDSNGSFSGTFKVPAKSKDTYKVKASDGTNKESVDFTVTAGASIDTTTGN